VLARSLVESVRFWVRGLRLLYFTTVLILSLVKLLQTVRGGVC
jgi:hypothetical protein